MSGLSLETIVPVSVLLASVVASPHCVAMCGPLALSLGRDKKKLTAYHIGRGLAYAGVGAAAGALGEKVLHASRLPALSLAAILFMTATVLFLGWRTWTNRPLHFDLLPGGARVRSSAWGWLRRARLPSWLAAGLGGSLSVLLPCGHLYGFLLGSAASGGALRGAIFMGLFWLGTLPAMGLGLVALQGLLRGGSRARARVAGSILVACGLFSVYLFASRLHAATVPADPHAAHASPAHHCH